MPLFFMLSGAVLHLKPLKRYDAFCASKIHRLIIPFFLYGFLFMLPVKFLGNFYAQNTISSAYRAFSQGGEAGHLWFLPALFWCMMSFVAIKKIFDRLNIQSLAVLLLSCGIVQIFSSRLPFDFFVLQKGLSYIFYFAVGFSFEPIREKLESLSIRLISALLVLYTIFIALNCKIAFLDTFPCVFFRSFYIVLLALLCSKAFTNLPQSMIFQTLKRNSFNIYLFHDPLEYVVLRLFFSERLQLLHTTTGVIAYCTARTLGVIIASIILGELVQYSRRSLIAKTMTRAFCTENNYNNQ